MCSSEVNKFFVYIIGYVIPTQNPKGSLNTKESREKPFGLIVTLNDNSDAIGDLYWDDGESSC